MRNQAPPLQPYNVYEADTALRRRWSARAAAGARTASPTPARWPARARRSSTPSAASATSPCCKTHDRYGNRVDEIQLDPSWHWLLREGIERGIHSLPWADPRPGAHTVRAGLMFLWDQVNARRDVPDLDDPLGHPRAARGPRPGRASGSRGWCSTEYGPGKGALAGMAMTEKQGGSDVRANTTSAEPQSDGTYAITGHKWFCSYPPCDVFLTLAQAPAGLSCFLIEGADPGFQVQRLKDKLGTRSLPSSEVEFRGVTGRLVGEEGRGVQTIIRMVNHTRLDCLIGSAVRHARGHRPGHPPRPPPHRRSATPLVDQPAMQNVLADLALESEAATATAIRIARGYDEDDAALPARGHRRVQVLGLQARAAARRRGAGVPGRQRLRGGVRACRGCCATRR